jgi:hypothetical protein
MGVTPEGVRGVATHRIWGGGLQYISNPPEFCQDTAVPTWQPAHCLTQSYANVHYSISTHISSFMPRNLCLVILTRIFLATAIKSSAVVSYIQNNIVHENCHFHTGLFYPYKNIKSHTSLTYDQHYQKLQKSIIPISEISNKIWHLIIDHIGYETSKLRTAFYEILKCRTRYSQYSILTVASSVKSDILLFIK